MRLVLGFFVQNIVQINLCSKQTRKLFTPPCTTCNYKEVIELEPAEIQNAKTSTGFLKEVNISDNKVFFFQN